MKTWRWPLLIGTLTVVGLVSALLGEGGLWWWICWIALSLPLAAIAFGILRRSPPGRS